MRTKRMNAAQMMACVVGLIGLLAGIGCAQTPPMYTTPTLPDDAKEKKILSVIEEVREHGPRRRQNVPTADGRFLRVLAESINAQKVVEIGTSNGYSSLWISAALVNTGGKLTTFEISHERAEEARANFKKAGVSDIITIVEGDAHENVKEVEGPIDMLFLDADKRGYIDYLDKLLPKVKPGGLVVAHNMTPRMADPDFLKAITENPKLETVLVAQPGRGLSITVKKR